MKDAKKEKRGRLPSGWRETVNRKAYSFRKDFRRDWQMHLLLLVPVVYIIVFSYWPMYGVQIAFRDFSPRKGITGSEWVGMDWFVKFLGNINFNKVLINTVVLSLESLIISFPLPIVFALLLNTITNYKLKKFIQNITYIPHFISVVVLVGMMNQMFSPINGAYGVLFRLFGGSGYPEDFRSMAYAFRPLYIGSGIWQNLGWNTIIYVAALGAVSPEHHEAAMIDGASRWKRIIHVDLPAIMPTICIMFILAFGSIMSVGFEKVYLMQSNLNLQTSEVISTYVYKVGMGTSGDLSYASAIGLFNSVINCSMLILVNWITRKASDNEMSMF